MPVPLSHSVRGYNERDRWEGVPLYMTSSRTITLFTESRDFGQQSTSFVVSFFFHCMALSLLSFGFIYTPHLDRRAIAERYTVRNIDLETPEQQIRRAERSRLAYPHPKPKTQPPAPGAKPDAHPPVLRQIAHAHKGPQTLVQPDLPTQITLAQEVPVPTIVIWSPQTVPVKTIVAPQPEKPTAADVKPAPDPPNLEVNLADNSISATPAATPKLPTPPTTTSPVAVQAPDHVQLAPSTVSQPSAQPTPAAVMSLSDLRMAQGKVILPPVNETADTNAPGTLAPGPATDPSALGDGKLPGNGGAGQGSSSPAGSNAAKLDKPPSPPPQAADAGLDQKDQPTSTRITLPKDGQFGAVVVGDALQDQFPELAHVWSGRLAYTVYLHVGLAKSWILQYSLPRDDDASQAGTIARLEAPWPYNIVRPNLTAGLAGVNTIMVHGFVTQAGRFETLNVVFPPQFPLAQFVINSLQRWQFRPASQNGQPAKVEVLLIIPQELE